MLKKLFVISLIILGLGQISFGQKAVSPAKKKLAVQLTERTVNLLPLEMLEMAFSKPVETNLAEIKTKIVDDLTKTIETSNLSEEKKSAVKIKVPAFSEKIAQITKELMSKDFNVKLWANKSLQQNYVRNFTVSELTKLNNFFGTKDGEEFVNLFSQRVSDAQAGKETTETSADEEIFSRIEKAVGRTTSNKLLDIAVKNTIDDVVKSVDIWGKNMLNDLKKATSPNGVIKLEVDKFIAENQ
jgi:hypothetical protein